ncbi:MULTISPECIES: hypothetical protein [Bartonella]|uniref:hypothetical protein n=1 Tax=Bartonella TaxID=773 RepID=UPI0011A70D47|nr:MULTISPECIES: hypothetical protein [Bartonella]
MTFLVDISSGHSKGGWLGGFWLMVRIGFDFLCVLFFKKGCLVGGGWGRCTGMVVRKSLSEREFV